MNFVNHDIRTGTDEMKRLFPGLYSGKASSGQVLQKRNITDEIAGDPEKRKLYDATVEFQAIFINMMLKSMRSNLNKEADMFYSGFSQDVFEDMLYDEYAKKMSASDRFPLANLMYNQLSEQMTDRTGDMNKNIEEYRSHQYSTSDLLPENRFDAIR